MNAAEQIREASILRFREQLPAAIERLRWSRAQLLANQELRLREILAFAKAHSPFYGERLRGVNPETFTLADLPGIEPITKADVMANWDRLVTDPALTLERANAHLAALRDGVKSNYYLDDRFYLSATGGSSGTRGLYVWDEDLFLATLATTNRIEALHDATKPPRDPRRTAVICAGSYLHGSRMLFPVAADPGRDVRVFPANTSIRDLVDQLNDYQPDRLVGYSSLVEELCVEALEGRLKIPLLRISVNSEPLTDEARDNARRAWGIGIHNGWGSVEFGVTGVEGDAFDGILLAEDVCIFEAISEHGAPIETGEADHLVMTRFYGRAMPLIRYVMTDSPVVAAPSGQGEAPAYRRITEIRGRADVWFTYGGLKIHPMVFRGVLGQQAAIIEYQVRQTPLGADVFLIAHETPDLAELARDIGAELSQAGLANPQVRVSVVDQLERHPETNKLTRFIALK
ncbi:hypothetical protein [Cerasicoccus frondis]|uniref:hypothetical protein n=1 Tax=Cerasicoccus frondis TaxID=490090 RepID=UPI0028526CE9|nr:hypothetical protein [Cerasicoccus frondis]